MSSDPEESDPEEADRGDAAEPRGRLDDIATRWTLLALAHEAPTTLQGEARGALVLKYGEAVKRYVAAMVRDEHDAADLAQDVLVRLLSGDFGGATPERGRFRALLKMAVRNMVRNHWRKEKRRQPVDLDPDEVSSTTDPVDQAWEEGWRKSLLDLTWRAIEAHEHSTKGNVFYTVLRLRTDSPQADSAALAETLSAATGRSFRAAACRQQLRRARLRFAQLLVEEVARSLDSPRPDAVRDELHELGLMSYVEDFLASDWDVSGVLQDAE